ncbi:MAG: hypothetical protein LBI34_00035 [Puniceicoccales bacterium]|jgi:hypothetical protein|nr:hypothetical protein [Puniceicoccales bacterium]
MDATGSRTGSYEAALFAVKKEVQQLRDVSESGVTGLKLIHAYRAAVSKMTSSVKDFASTLETVDKSELSKYEDASRKLIKNARQEIAASAAAVRGKQNPIFSFFYSIFFKRIEIRQLTLFAKAATDAFEGIHDRIVRERPTVKTTNVAEHTQISAPSVPSDPDLRSLAAHLKSQMLHPAPGVLAAGNEKPILVPKELLSADFVDTPPQLQLMKFFRIYAGNPSAIGRLPITGKTIGHTKGIISSFFAAHGCKAPDLLNPSELQEKIQDMFGTEVDDISGEHANVPPEDREVLIGFLNVCLSCSAAEDKETFDFFKRLSSIFIASINAAEQPGVREELSKLAVGNVDVSSSADVDFAEIDKFFDEQESPKGSEQQYAIKNCPDMRFMQYVRNENMALFADAIIDEFSTYATNPKAMQYMRAVITKIAPEAKVTVLAKLAAFADTLANDLQADQANASKKNQLRALTELLLANDADDLPDLSDSLCSINDAIVGSWNHCANIDPNEIAMVVQIAALKERKGMHLSEGERKNIALLTANPRYGFCQKVHNTRSVQAPNAKFDPIQNCNFRCYYGSENSLIPISVIESISAIETPAEFITPDDMQTAFGGGLRLELNADNGVFLCEGALPVESKQLPPLMMQLDKITPNIALSLNRRSEFPNQQTQCIDGKVTVDLVTGKATHADAGEFMRYSFILGEGACVVGEPTALNDLKRNFVAFLDKDNVIRFYTSANFREPAFLMRDGKFYSAKNPEMELVLNGQGTQCKDLPSECLIGRNADGIPVEAVVLNRVILEKGKAPCRISFRQSGDAGKRRLELYSDGEKTDCFLMSQNILSGYAANAGDGGFIIASDKKPLELTLPGRPSALFSPRCEQVPVTITLPEKEDDDIIFGRVDSEGNASCDEQEVIRLGDLIAPNATDSKDDFFSGPYSKNRIRSLITYFRNARAARGGDPNRLYGQDDREALKGRVHTVLGWCASTIHMDIAPGARSLLNELILDMALVYPSAVAPMWRNSAGGGQYHASFKDFFTDDASTYHSQAATLFIDAYKSVQFENPESPVLNDFIEFLNIASTHYTSETTGWIHNSTVSLFRKKEQQRLNAKKAAKTTEDIRAHLPKVPKRSRRQRISPGQLRAGRIPSQQDSSRKQLGVDVRMERFSNPSDPDNPIDVASAGASALERLGITEATRPADASIAESAAEEEASTDLAGRLGAYRRGEAAAAAAHADACWDAIGKRFVGIDATNPDTFAIADAEAETLRSDLFAAEESLKSDERSISSVLDKANEIIENILLSVTPQVKLLRISGALPMPTSEKLQMLLFRCYNSTDNCFDRDAFWRAYAREFDPYITARQVDDLIDALLDQLVCKTALSACRNRLRTFEDFKAKIQLLIAPPTTESAESRLAKLTELKAKQNIISQARTISTSYCIHEKACRTAVAEQDSLARNCQAERQEIEAQLQINERTLQKNEKSIREMMSKGFIVSRGGPSESFECVESENLEKVQSGIKACEDKIAAALVSKRAAHGDTAILEDGDIMPADNMFRGALNMLGVGRITYKQVRFELAKLRESARELDAMKLASVELIKEFETLQAERAELTRIMDVSTESYHTKANEFAATIRNARSEIETYRIHFATLRTQNASLLQDLELNPDDIQEASDGELFFPAIETLSTSIGRDIEGLKSDTRGKILAVRESFGAFIKSMAAARAYDAFDRRNFSTLWFEAQTEFRLRPDQVKLISDIFEKSKRGIATQEEVQLVFQLMMGGGKTAIVLSELARLLAGAGKIPFFANHEAQHATMTKDLRKLQEVRFGQAVIEINMPLSGLATLAGANNILSQLKRAKETGACVTIPSTLLRGISLERRSAIIGLRDARIARDEPGISKDDRIGIRGKIRKLEERLNKFEEVLGFIKENCVMICDEVHANLDPTFSVNIPNGKRQTFSSVQAECNSRFFQRIDGNDEIKSAIRSGTGISEDSLSHIAMGMLDDFGIPADDANRELYRRFICCDDAPDANRAKDDAEFRVQWDLARARLAGENPELLERLCMLRGLITTERYASRKSYLGNYGFRIIEGKLVKVVPYSSANTPSSGDYAHPIELSVYTNHAYMLSHTPNFGDGTPLDIKFRDFIQKAIQKPDSPERKYLELYMETFAERAEELKNSASPQLGEKLIKDAYSKLVAIFAKGAGTSDRSSLVCALTRDDFMFYPGMLEGTGYNQMHLTKTVIADSGTPWNLDILSAGFQRPGNSMLDTSTNMQICSKWASDMKAGNSVVFNGKGDGSTVAQMLDAQAKAHGNDSQATCALIDVAGAFKHLRNREVARQTRDYCASKSNSPFKGFAFFEVDPNTGKSDWWVMPRDPNSPPIKLSNNQEGTVLKEAGITREELFVYFDQNKTTGVDFKLPQSGRGLVTADPGKTLISNFLQGVLRLRGFWDGQSADVCQVGQATDGMTELEGAEEHEAQFLQCFESVEANQDSLLNARKVGAVTAQIIEKKRILLELRQEQYYKENKWAIDHGNSPFVPSYWLRRFEALQKECADACLTDARFDPVGWYGATKNEADAYGHIVEMRKKTAASLVGCGLSRKFLRETEFIMETASHQLAGVKMVIGGAAVDVGAEVETQAEAETETEAEQQMEVSSQNDSASALKSLGDSLVDRHRRAAGHVESRSGGVFMKKLLSGFLGELTVGETFRVGKLALLLGNLMSGDDFSDCRERCCTPLSKRDSPTTGGEAEKVPGKFFDTVRKDALGFGVPPEKIINEMDALAKAVTRTLKTPKHEVEENENPEKESVLEWFQGIPTEEKIRYFGEDESAQMAWINAAIALGYSKEQITKTFGCFEKCSNAIDKLIESAKADHPDMADDEETPSDERLTSFKDLQTDPENVGRGLLEKVQSNAYGLLNGIIGLLNIYLEDGQEASSITSAAGGVFNLIGGTAQAFLSGGQDLAGLVVLLPTMLRSITEKKYVTRLDAVRKQKILKWIEKDLAKLLGNFFVPQEAQAMITVFQVACRLTLPPDASEAAKEMLAKAILESCRNPKTGMYDMKKASEFADIIVGGFADFIKTVAEFDIPGASDEYKFLVDGLASVLRIAKGPLFDPLLAAAQDVKKYLVQIGGQRADALVVCPTAIGDPEDEDESVEKKTCTPTTGSMSINEWLTEQSGQTAGFTGRSVNIFPSEFCASEQFMHAFEGKNDPSSNYSRSAQRMLVYKDSAGKMKGMLLTPSEVDDYGEMIMDGALKDARIIDTRGKPDDRFAPEDNPMADVSEGDLKRFALYMQIYNGTINVEALNADGNIRTLFLGITHDEPQRDALIGFLGSKTQDSSWVSSYIGSAAGA